MAPPGAPLPTTPPTTGTTPPTLPRTWSPGPDGPEARCWGALGRVAGVGLPIVRPVAVPASGATRFSQGCGVTLGRRRFKSSSKRRPAPGPSPRCREHNNEKMVSSDGRPGLSLRGRRSGRCCAFRPADHRGRTRAPVLTTADFLSLVKSPARSRTSRLRPATSSALLPG